MFILNSNITITDPGGSYYLENLPLSEVQIEKSRKTLTNTAKIIIPRNLKVFKNSQQVDINTIIQRGAAVTIQLGYDGNLTTEFTGYVSSLGAMVPIEVHCEDAMWTLKQNSFTQTWPKGTKLADIISAIYPGLAVVADLQLGGLKVINQSTAQILKALRKFGIQSYFGTDAFNNVVLYVDFAGVVHPNSTEVLYQFGTNIIKSDLVYKLKEDARIKVIAVSKLSTGGKLQVSVGDNGGEVHTLHYVDMDADQLQKIATAEINKLLYEGYKGTFTTFGVPIINPGDKASINDPVYPDHDGVYLVLSVKTTFGANGFRREIELERKLTA